MNKGKLIVISGPSGAGKGTVIKQVLQQKNNVALSVSCTTRAPRPESGTVWITTIFQKKNLYS